MSIRLKLVLSYAAMLIIPLVTVMITASLLVVAFRGEFQTVRDTYGPKKGWFENEYVGRMLKELKRTSEKNPALLADSGYWSDIDSELKAGHSYLIVRRENTLTFVSPAFEQSELLNHLPSFEHAGRLEREEAQRYDDELYEIIHLDFMYPDQQQGTIFVVTTVNPMVNFARKFFPILFVSLILILILTHTLLTYFVSRSIIRPLQNLKKAMKRLEAGDLDYQVQVTSKDEIGQLGEAFEQMRKQLQQSISTQLQYEENRKELISNISHDLRTPLTAIRGYVDGLEDGIADTPDKRKKYIEIISSKAEEMDQLIDELFLYSKLDLKRLPFNFEMLELDDFLLDWSEELDFELSKKEVRFISNISIPQSTKVSIDRDKIKRVFYNVIDNGLKYMNKPEKQMELRAYSSGNNAIIEIADNGQGVEPEALPYIFERFYRAEQSRNSETGGSGLGLAISKQIVEGHGGTISARSTKGEGTCVIITLPLRR